MNKLNLLKLIGASLFLVLASCGGSTSTGTTEPPIVQPPEPPPQVEEPPEVEPPAEEPPAEEPPAEEPPAEEPPAEEPPAEEPPAEEPPAEEPPAEEPPAEEPPADEPGNGWTLVWQDEFNGSSIDMTKWSHEVNCWGGGNNELQCYTDRPVNSYVENGRLHIVALQEAFSGPAVTDDHPSYDPGDVSGSGTHTSARLRTKHKGDWRYGRIDVRARMPEGQGLWPAIWMLPTDEVYGGWPLSGEIDIFEAVNTNASGGNTIYGTLHYGREWPNNLHAGQAYTPVANIAQEFHTYTVEWEQGVIRWYVDGLHFATQTDSGWFTYSWQGQEYGYQLGTGAAPFDQEFHLILNVAVGGDWPGNPDGGTQFPQTMEVEYVRVYECSFNTLTGAGCASDVNPSVGVSGHSAAHHSFPLYTNGAGALDGAALAPAFWEASGGNVVADPALDIGGGQTVWDVQFNGPGNIFLLADAGANIDNFILADPFDGAGWNDTGDLIFDLRVQAIQPGTSLEVKLDSGWPNVSYYAIDVPPTGEWTTVAVRFSDLIPNPHDGGGQADFGNIVAPFVMEAVGGTAHVQINNLRLRCLSPCGVDSNESDTSGNPVITENMDVFVGDLAPNWGNPGFGVWQSGGPGIVIDVVGDPDQTGNVIEFTYNLSGGDIGLAFIQDAQPKDLSAFSSGQLVFDLKVISQGNNTDGFTVKADCIHPCQSAELSVPLPGDGDWHPISIDIADFFPGTGFDLSQVDAPFVIWPVFGQQDGVVFRVANVRWLLP